MQVALDENQIEVVKLFIKKNGVANKVAEKLLLDAAIAGNGQLVETLIGEGIDVNCEVCLVFMMNMAFVMHLSKPSAPCRAE